MRLLVFLRNCCAPSVVWAGSFDTNDTTEAGLQFCSVGRIGPSPPRSSGTDDATEAGLQFCSVGRIGPSPPDRPIRTTLQKPDCSSVAWAVSAHPRPDRPIRTTQYWERTVGPDLIPGPDLSGTDIFVDSLGPLRWLIELKENLKRCLALPSQCVGISIVSGGTRFRRYV